MGILDSLENSPAFKSALGQMEAAVVPVVLNEVMGNNGQGGLSAILAKLQQAGLGDQVKSWLGNGSNLPITAEQLQQVLGSDTVRQLAARFNIPVDQLVQVLAQQLPGVVDHASPEGKLPQGLDSTKMALVPGWGQDLCQARAERLGTIPISLKKKGYDLPFGAPI